MYDIYKVQSLNSDHKKKMKNK